MNEELSQEEVTTKLAKDMNRNPSGKGGFGERPQDINPGGKPANSMKSFIVINSIDFSSLKNNINSMMSGRCPESPTKLIK